MNVFLTGATGFVGRSILSELLVQGHSVHALVRSLQAQKSGLLEKIQSDGHLQCFQGDVVSGAGIEEAIQGCDAVIHLVGIIIEKGSNTFEAVHYRGTKNVVQAACRSGAKRFVHMSALGVRGDGVAAYQRSKWKGEQEVRQSGVPYCILRPSLIFGPGDGFVTQMTDMMKKAPLFRPVPGNGRLRFRPISIDDVTSCFVRALTAEGATNQTIELGGADELSLDEVLAEIARCAGSRKPPIHIPLPLMFIGAALASLLPNPRVTVDQLRMLREGSTCDIEPILRIFGIKPKGFQGCGRS